MEKVIQIVAFDVPYPADYGGVIDIFYKVKSLAGIGISVILHCYEYNRPQQQELENYCTKVYYYPRKTGFRYQLKFKPYIVATRSDEHLLENLLEEKAPIIFEGLHSCFFLNHPLLRDHCRIVRTHNIEHEYYLKLGKSEKNFLKKLFFRIEAWKLKRFEKVLKHANHLLCISPKDQLWFTRKYGKAHFIPAFHPFDHITSKVGIGQYVLFHGNLSVSENILAVEFIIERVVPKLKNPVIIAGKNPPLWLKNKIALKPNMQLVENPEGNEMSDLIRNAHVLLLPTFQDTGLKLKLLASLFSGRFCLANGLMVNHTGLEHLCLVVDSPVEMSRITNELFEVDFSLNEIRKRREILEAAFSNKRNAQIIAELISEKMPISQTEPNLKNSEDGP